MHKANENEESEDWCVYCSDDEKYGVTSKKVWEPPTKEIIELYQILDNSRDEAFELDWQCPGRRGPSPSPDEPYQQDDASLESKTEEKSDFDFSDDFSVQKFQRAVGGPKGSAKKKTTSLDGILSNMRRHRMLETQDSNK